MDYVVFTLVLVCCFRGWLKTLLFSILCIFTLLVVLLLVFKNSNFATDLVSFLTDTKLSGLLYEKVLKKITNLF